MQFRITNILRITSTPSNSSAFFNAVSSVVRLSKERRVSSFHVPYQISRYFVLDASQVNCHCKCNDDKGSDNGSDNGSENGSENGCGSFK